eukprot:909638-Prorocentrum_lima.AAC.1
MLRLPEIYVVIFLALSYRISSPQKAVFTLCFTLPQLHGVFLKVCTQAPNMLFHVEHEAVHHAS